MDDQKKLLVPKFLKLPVPLPQEGGEILEQACAKSCTEVKANVLELMTHFRRPDDNLP